MCQHTIIGIIICLHHKLHVMNPYISDLHINLWTHQSTCIYQKTCYQLFRVINVCIPEDVYYQQVHRATGNTWTTAYQKWHILTHTRQQKANTLNLMVPDIKESLINTPTRWGTLINLPILAQTFKVCKSVHHHTIQINQTTRCNNFSSNKLEKLLHLVGWFIWIEQTCYQCVYTASLQ